MQKIFTNGCFDIIHRGHLELFKYCKTLGYVIVGLNSDASVKTLKGESRQINNQDDRKLLLESLKYIDEVHIFDEETPLNLIKEIKPNYIVKGGDYKDKEVVGSDIADVVLFDFVNGYSSSSVIQKMKK